MWHKTASITLALIAGGLLTTAVLRSQMPSVGPQWEYSMVTGSHGKATICYATATHCKTGDVKPGNDSLMAAAHQLGEKGWELAAAETLNGDRPGRSEQILYFKRLKSVIHRPEFEDGR
jgi:hypothetical protein